MDKNNTIGIKEFAKLLGTSTATISRAFNNNGRISPKTRERILEQANEVGYRPNIHARYLSTQKQTNIAFFYPTYGRGETDTFISGIILGASDTVAKTQTPFQIHPFSGKLDNNHFCIELLLNGGIGGAIVFAGASFSSKLIETADKINLPHVTIGYNDNLTGPRVIYEISKGAFLAGQQFKNNNRSKPLYIRGFQDEYKFDGFLKGLGRTEDEITVLKGGSTFEDGADAFSAIKDSIRNYDCAFFSNDILAIGFLRMALQHGIDIPNELMIIGCDNLPIAAHYTPALSSVRLHRHEIGRLAVEKLQLQMSNQKYIEKEIVNCKLITRETSLI